MKLVLFFAGIFFGVTAMAQSFSINTDGSTAHTSALLDVKSTAKGLLLPRMTKTQKNAIVTPATGLLIFQTSPDSIGFHYYDGSLWQWLDPFVGNAWKTTGNTGTDTSVNFIGTTDNMPLRFKQANVRMGQLDINNANYFFGKGAGVKSLSTSFSSVGLGDSALANLTTGDNNIAIGTNSLNTITTGSNNTAIGFQADAGSSGLTNATSVGALAQVDASNAVVLGSVNGVNGATSNVNVGIGTTSPNASLHLRKAPSGSSLAIPTDRTLLVENNGSSFIQLLNPDNAQTGIFSGNTLTVRRSGVMFNADSSVSVRTGGSNTEKVYISRLGDVGIGNTNPQGRLHICEPSPLSNAQYFTNSNTVFEYSNFGNTALQLMCRAGSNFSIFSGTDSVFARSRLEFSSDSSMRFYTGGNVGSSSNMVLSKTGSLGIGATAPTAKLDVAGTFKLGTNGTVNAALINETVNINVGSIPANGELDVTVAVPNVITTAAVSVSPSADLASGIIIGWVRVSSTGNVRIRFRNLTGGAINPAAIDYYISAIQ